MAAAAAAGAPDTGASDASTDTHNTPLVTHRGGCHCGAVRWEVDAPAAVVAWDCNCSVCAMKRNTHFIVPAGRFRLAPSTAPAAVTEYRFGTRTARHMFCATCGVQSYYHPRSNPDGVAVTVHCVDAGTLSRVTTRAFDGAHWEDAFAATGIAAASKVAPAAAAGGGGGST
jgi:hypothetical protein